MMNPLRDELTQVKSKVHFYLGLGRYQVAEKLLQTTLDEYGSLANIHNLLGVTYHKQSRFPDALAQFKKAQECNPAYTEATLNLIATLCDLSCYDQAQHIHSALCQDLSTSSSNSQLLMGRLADRHAQCGNLYDDLGQSDKAIAEYEKALSLYPRMPDVKLALARIFIHKEQYPRAHKELDELVSLAPELAKPYTWLGILYYKMGKKGQAKVHWDKAYQLNSQDPVNKAFNNIARDWPLDSSSSLGRPL